MEDRGEREDYCAEGSPTRADEETEEDGGFEGDVGGEKVGYGGANPDAERKGYKKEGEESEGLLGAALFREKQTAESGSARQYTGDGRHDTQLDEQGDQNKPVGHVTSVLREIEASSISPWLQRTTQGQGRLPLCSLVREVQVTALDAIRSSPAAIGMQAEWGMRLV